MKAHKQNKDKKRLWTALFLCIMTIGFAYAQNRTVKVSVTDTSEEPIIGASVQVKGTTRGGITDVNGNFQIEVSSQDHLIISYVGYKTTQVSAQKTDIKVVLEEDLEMLDEVVVVGYGTQKKATLTGAVSAVTNDEIIKTRNENVVNMLTGKLPGVRISQRSAQPGEFDNAFDIRGMGTPLFVIDGVPRDQGYFSRMDASEIESISVLKDASAAVYGVRAANGVVIVTTKRGTVSGDGKVDIQLSANYGWQKFLYVPHQTSVVEYMQLANEKTWHDFNQNYMYRKPGLYSDEEIEAYRSGQKQGTDWMGLIFDETAPTEQYNLNVNGGTERLSYFFNLGYMKQMGNYKSGSLNYDRWNFRANIDAKITNRLKASLSLGGYMDEKNQPFVDMWTVYKKAWTNRPTVPAFLDGNPMYPCDDDNLQEHRNPVVVTDSEKVGYRRYKNNVFNGALTLTYDIPGVEGLNARAYYGYDYSANNDTEYKKVYYYYAYDQNNNIVSSPQEAPSYVQRSTSPNFKRLMQLSLNYAHQFGDHNVSGMLMFEEEYNNWDSFYAKRELYLESEYLFAGEDKNQVGNMNGVGDTTNRSLIGKFGYDYQGKYIGDFSFRYDGSSKFPAESRWGFFWSGSLAWRLSEEAFIKDNVDFIDNLKLRASYGKLGDDGSAGTYPSIYTGYNLSNNDYGYFWNGVYTGGVTATSIPNPNLTWYVSKTWDLGLDFDLWNGKLSGTLDIFKRKRSGLLATSSAVVPGTVGASMPQENIESDQTFGWEFMLGHRNRVGEVTYDVSVNLSATKNRWDYHIDSMAGNSMDNWRRQDVSGRNKGIWWGIEEGGRFSSYEQIYNHPTTGQGVGQGTLPGDYWYEDWNGDGVVNGNDNHPIATKNMPVFNFGINMGAAWKGIDVTMNWQGSAGVYSEYAEVFAEVLAFNGAALDIYADRWRPVDPNADLWDPATKWIEGYYPATGSSFTTGTTGVKNTSYIRLKTLEIGYTLPKSWVSKVGIEDLRVYVSGYNLLTFTGLKDMDPERPGKNGSGASTSDIAFYNYPNTKIFNIGATIKF